jgi:hypothetical protein
MHNSDRRPSDLQASSKGSTLRSTGLGHDVLLALLGEAFGKSDQL